MTFTFDEARAAFPDLAMNLYAMEPRGLVVLEIIDPVGETYVFRGSTAAEALASAFPEAPPEPAAPAESVFD